MNISWRFVQSSSYSVVSTTVSVITLLFLIVLVIWRELYLEAPVRSATLRLLSAYALAMPLLLAFVAVIGIRVVGIVKLQPTVHHAGTAKQGLETAQPTAAQGQLASPPARGAPPVSHFFISGGISSPGTHAYVRFLNPTTQIASARLTFFLANGMSVAKILDIPPTTEQEVPVTSLEKLSGVFDS
jgi:hypothetical protein